LPKGKKIIRNVHQICDFGDNPKFNMMAETVMQFDWFSIKALLFENYSEI